MAWELISLRSNKDVKNNFIEFFFFIKFQQCQDKTIKLNKQLNKSVIDSSLPGLQTAAKWIFCNLFFLPMTLHFVRGRAGATTNLPN